MKRKKVYIAVTNDLVGDQRVHKVATSLQKNIGDVTLIGRYSDTTDKVHRNYKTKRLRLLFKRSFLFYIEYNFRLFLFLLLKRCDIIVANDLDSLLGSYSISVLKRKPLVYDSHEYFTEVPELQGRILVKKVWGYLEGVILSRIKYAYTVCESIADIYKRKYGIEMQVVRNVPFLQHLDKEIQKENIIIYQGAINIGRGLEESVLAMQYVDNAKLLIYGDGDIYQNIEALIKDNSLEEKVFLQGRVPFQQLFPITQKAKLGLCIDRGKEMGLSYYYSLPNRLFDYIQAGVPVLLNDLPEKRRIQEEYNIGYLMKSYDAKTLGGQISEIIDSSNNELAKKLEEASKQLCWENEEIFLLKLYNSIV